MASLKLGGDSAGVALNNYGNVFGGEILIHSSDSSFFRNNVLVPLGQRRCVVVPDSYIATNLSFDYNNFYKETLGAIFDIGSGASANGRAGIQSYSYINVPGLDKNTISTYPRFIDTATQNYRLQISSPCIDAGDPASSTDTVSMLDYDGYPRLYNNRIDMGAFESQAVIPTAVFTPNVATTFKVSVAPNPVSDRCLITSTEPVAAITIVGITGNILLKQSSPLGTISLVNLPMGTYLIVAENMQGVHAAIVIQKR